MTEDRHDFPLGSQAHRRYDPLSDSWVLVSVGRNERPWLGHVETLAIHDPREYDPDCYLCPGNARANGERNPHYKSTHVFTNDFAALQPNASTDAWQDGLLKAEGASGTSRVVCYSPRHDVSVGAMSSQDVRQVIDTWADETAKLSSLYPSVQVFENRGSAMGASSPHPHGQIWAASSIPVELARERVTQQDYVARTGNSMLADYEATERDGERAVVQTDLWTIVVPFWATWPFETLVLPRFDVARLPETSDAQRDDLARALIEVLGAYDGLFGVPFPYSMGWHQAPTDKLGSASDRADGWQLHAHFYPPLLRSATVRKFLVGYELLAEPQRDLTPEEAATRLRRTGPAGP